MSIKEDAVVKTNEDEVGERVLVTYQVLYLFLGKLSKGT